MTDYFALLDQPRQPWLDSEKLKQAFHEKTRHAHPDAASGGEHASGKEAVFTEVNEAYQLLRDPRRRLQHLLSLEGRPPASGSGMIPPEIADAFEIVAVSTQAVERALEKSIAAGNALSRSLVRVEIERARAEVGAALAKLVALEQAAERELRALNEAEPGTDHRLERIESLYFRYAYLTRWIAQLEEKKTQLAML